MELILRTLAGAIRLATMPRGNPKPGGFVRPRDTTSQLRGYIAPTSSLDQGDVIIRDVVDGTLIGCGTWKELRKVWLLMKSVNTQRRVLTVPLLIDSELVRLGAEQGRSPEAVAIELLRGAIGKQRSAIGK